MRVYCAWSAGVFAHGGMKMGIGMRSGPMSLFRNRVASFWLMQICEYADFRGDELLLTLLRVWPLHKLVGAREDGFQ